MGDFHFLVRHALTGAVFLFFLFIGFLLFFNEYNEIIPFFKALGNEGGIKIEDISSIFTLVVTAPVIGITIQGIVITFLHLTKTFFNDEARNEVAAHIKGLIAKGCEFGVPKGKIEGLNKHFNELPDDALFVLLYHIDAPPHLIEWARRRRSYGYLGWNWAIAAVTGIILGSLIHLIKGISPEPIYIKILILLFTSVWIAGAIWLSKKMKHDVDSMEFVWTCGCLYPKLRNEIYKAIRAKENEQKINGAPAILQMMPNRKLQFGYRPRNKS